MLRLKLMGILLVVVLSLGCAGSSENKDDSTDQANTAANTDNSVQKSDDTANTTDDDVVADDTGKTDDAVESVGDFEWVYVLEPHGVEPNSLKKIKTKLAETFLKDLSYSEVDPAKYQSSMARYAGKKLIKMKIEYSYGNFDLSLLRSTIELDEGDAVEVPIPEYRDLRIQHAENLKRFLKEIDFLLKQDQKNKETD